MSGVAASLSDEQKKAFEERLRRIASGGPNTMQQIYVGESASAEIASVNDRSLSIMGAILGLPLAVMVGGLSMITGRLGSYHLMSVEKAATVPALAGLSPELGNLVGALLVATVVCMILRWALRLQGRLRGTAIAIGFIAVLLAEDAMIERAPELYARLYSEDFVLQRLYPEPALLRPDAAPGQYRSATAL